MAQAPSAGTEDLHGAAAGGDDARARLHLRVGQDCVVEADGLEDAQHLVVEDGGARERIGLFVAVEGERADAVVAEQQRQQLADRPKPADGDLVHQTGAVFGLMVLVSVPIWSISSCTVCPGLIQRSSSSPQQPGIVPIESTSPASSFSPALQ
jgi:hypothetical protein